MDAAVMAIGLRQRDRAMCCQIVGKRGVRRRNEKLARLAARCVRGGGVWARQLPCCPSDLSIGRGGSAAGEDPS
jgi:hypothetical protein